MGTLAHAVAAACAVQKLQRLLVLRADRTDKPLMVHPSPSTDLPTRRHLEDRLCSLVAYLTAFFRLTQAGHLPDAVLRAVAKDLRLNHDCFNCPNPLPIFEAAVERRRIGRRRSGRFVVRG